MCPDPSHTKIQHRLGVHCLARDLRSTGPLAHSLRQRSVEHSHKHSESVLEERRGEEYE